MAKKLKKKEPKKIGRPLSVGTSEELWSLFEEYVLELKSKPFKVKDWVGKDGDQVEREKEKPLTFEGFQNFCRRKVGTIHHYFEEPDNFPQFRDICRAIKSEIRQNQIEGGMAMLFNPSITQRLNGLVEKTDNKNENISRVINIEVVKSEVPISSSEKGVKLD